MIKPQIKKIECNMEKIITQLMIYTSGKHLATVLKSQRCQTVGSVNSDDAVAQTLHRQNATAGCIRTTSARSTDFTVYVYLSCHGN